MLPANTIGTPTFYADNPPCISNRSEVQVHFELWRATAQNGWRCAVVSSCSDNSKSTDARRWGSRQAMVTEPESDAVVRDSRSSGASGWLKAGAYGVPSQHSRPDRVLPPL